MNWKLCLVGEWGDQICILVTLPLLLLHGGWCKGAGNRETGENTHILVRGRWHLLDLVGGRVGAILMRDLRGKITIVTEGWEGSSVFPNLWISFKVDGAPLLYRWGLGMLLEMLLSSGGPSCSLHLRSLQFIPGKMLSLSLLWY